MPFRRSDGYTGGYSLQQTASSAIQLSKEQKSRVDYVLSLTRVTKSYLFGSGDDPDKLFFFTITPVTKK